MRCRPIRRFFSGFDQFSEKLSQFSIDNYVWLTEDALYRKAYTSSLVIAFISTVITILVGYPLAYAMARAPGHIRPLLLMMIILPFWTSFLIRVYAWIGILKPEGLLNQLLLLIGVIDEPLIILNTNIAVYIGIVYSYLPFMVLPLYATLERLDRSLLEAAADLGATPIRAFWQVTLPLSVPGIVAGSLLVFIPAVGEFVIPDILGGSNTLMIGRTLWVEFFQQPGLAGRQRRRDYPAASPGDTDRPVPERPGQEPGGGHMNRRLSSFNIVSLVLGFSFLYLPIVLLIIYSFNASRLVNRLGRLLHEVVCRDAEQ